MSDTAEPKPIEANDATRELLQFFTRAHLPKALRATAEPFDRLAREIVLNLPESRERYESLRHVLDAKECAIRARLIHLRSIVESSPAPKDGAES